MAPSLPTIGINTNLEPEAGACDLTLIKSDYWQAVLAAGALPVLMPQFDSPDLIDAFLDRVDGFLMIGGGDISPARLGLGSAPGTHPVHPRRERTDFLLLERLLSRAVPTLGICLACQQLNVVHGGTLYLDLPTDGPPGALRHTTPPGGPPTHHRLALAPGTRLCEIVGVAESEVNSYHHQAIREPGVGLSVAARSPDGVIEAVEVATLPFFIGVQWHPERLPDAPATRKLFAALRDHALKS